MITLCKSFCLNLTAGVFVDLVLEIREQGRGGGRYGDTSRSDIKRDSSKAHGNPADSTYPQGEVDPLLDSLEALAAAGALDDDDLLQEYVSILQLLYSRRSNFYNFLNLFQLRADPRLEEELYYRAIHDRNLLEEARRIGGDLVCTFISFAVQGDLL